MYNLIKTLTGHPGRKALRILSLFTIILLLLAPLFGSIQNALAAPISIIDDGGSNDPNGDGQNDLTRLTGDEYVTAHIRCCLVLGSTQHHQRRQCIECLRHVRHRR